MSGIRAHLSVEEDRLKVRVGVLFLFVGSWREETHDRFYILAFLCNAMNAPLIKCIPLDTRVSSEAVFMKSPSQGSALKLPEDCGVFFFRTGSDG